MLYPDKVINYKFVTNLIIKLLWQMLNSSNKRDYANKFDSNHVSMYKSNVK